MIQLHPENDPGGIFGDSLRGIAADLRLSLYTHATLHDGVVVREGEEGPVTELAPDYAVAATQIDVALNGVGAAFKAAREMMDRITEMSREEFEAARPQIEAAVPGFNIVSFYERHHKRDPGRVGRFFRPALRVLGLEPPYWREPKSS